MSQELIPVSQAEVVTVVASCPTEFPVIQTTVLQWAEKKHAAAQVEFSELDVAWKLAKEKKWKHSTIQTAANRALKRLTFYEKVVMALRAGYMLFPPVDKADVIAVRRERDHGNWQCKTVGWSGSPALEEAKTESRKAGEGEWYSPWMKWDFGRDEKDEKGNIKHVWFLDTDLEDAEFPLSMARPEIIQATSAAMEQKFFDEIRLFPFAKKRGDPVILGTIVDKSGSGYATVRTRLYFMISWRINETDF